MTQNIGKRKIQIFNKFFSKKPKIEPHMIEKKCWPGLWQLRRSPSLANKALIIRCVYMAGNIYIYRYLYSIIFSTYLLNITHMCVQQN